MARFAKDYRPTGRMMLPAFRMSFVYTNTPRRYRRMYQATAPVSRAMFGI
jgi:hypothetical protein